jgi:hypothetical protein
MLESIMYFGIGFLFAALIGLAIFPRVHGRAVRLTTRRLEAAIPPSITEVQADKDLLRAEFAMSTRRLETTVEQLNNRNASQLAELGRKGDALGRLTIERNAQQAAVTALKIEVEALKERLTATGKEVNAEGDVVPRAPTEWPTVDSSQGPPLNDRHHEGDVVSPVPKQWPTLEIARPDGPARDPDAGRMSSDQDIGSAREKYDFSAGLRAVEPSIHVFPRPSGVENDQFTSEGTSIGRRAFRTFVRLCIAVLTGVGATVAWQYHGDDVKEMARTWAASPGGLSSVSTMTSPPVPASVAAATSPELVQQPAVARDLADVRPGVDQLATKQEQLPPAQARPATAQDEPAVTQEQPAAKQEQVARNVATPQAVEQDVRPKTSSSPRQPRAKLTPWPDTRPTTSAGWTLRGVTNGTAVLEGPNGVWRATRGDTVPGVGRVESIVRWGNRWLVATSSGLISTP